MTPTNATAVDDTTRQHNSTLPPLPTLEPGLTLLAVDPGAACAIHALAVDHVLLTGGEAYWVDPGTHARTGSLVNVAPSARILQHIHVARGFTPFQHLALLDGLPETLTGDTELVVVPAVDRYYRDDDLLGDEGREMLLAAVASLAGVARTHDLPVLVTRTSADQFSEPVEAAAANTLQCEATPFGPRFYSEDEGTLTYPVDGGRWLQTTLTFWADVLAAREPLYEETVPSATTCIDREVTVRGTN